MGKHCQLVMGPAGSGKSTYTNAVRIHCENSKRIVHCINLDPAAETFHYPVAIDIRDVITVDEVMEELPYGPNGGLVYAMEYFLDNLDWFEEQLGDYEDDYLLIDCPGQIELYSHIDVMQRFVNVLQNWGYRVCGVYLLDSHFIVDSAKFISGIMMCLSAMVRLELPHVNVLTKMDLVSKKAGRVGVDDEDDLERRLNKFLNPDTGALLNDLNRQTSKRFSRLNDSICSLIDDYSMVRLVPLDITDEDSIGDLLIQIDNAIQYGEDLEPKEIRDEEDPDVDDGDNEGVGGLSYDDFRQAYIGE
eukprot:TRINITY_DN26696_c0_g1_i1.p1 TRINITY_DN26696_c0_g1~~TRINITY_DN26696_c0_g1_i1.p1  ORF type:complete len:303 (-),score=108.05 TRINITY_DN26696_c0_g1_i1:274-1182(-)